MSSLDVSCAEENDAEELASADPKTLDGGPRVRDSIAGDAEGSDDTGASEPLAGELLIMACTEDR